jgi:hypothetical protein
VQQVDGWLSLQVAAVIALVLAQMLAAHRECWLPIANAACECCLRMSGNPTAEFGKWQRSQFAFDEAQKQ